MNKRRKIRWPTLPRIILVSAFVLAFTAFAVRTAAVSAAKSSADFGARAWPDHPRMITAALMRDVGQAAAGGQPLDPVAIARIKQLATAEPLSSVPFLVRAAVAEKAGRFAESERLLIEARRRDPRAPAARLLLAQAFLRRGATLAALEEMAVLSRLVPGSLGPLTQALAAHARSPSGIAELKALLARRPDLADPLLGALASDPSNTPAILALIRRPGAQDGSGTAPAWQSKILNALVSEGRFDLARTVWLKITGRPLENAIFNSGFAETSAPAPFNWTLAKSGGAVAEPDHGRLHVVHFGRDDMIVAGQVLVLSPGRYRVSMSVAGEVRQPGQLRWQVRCLPAGQEILGVPVRSSPDPGQLIGEFIVPADGCAGQALELMGSTQDFPADADATFGGLSLSRLPA